MKYNLMYKNIPVLSLKFQKDGSIKIIEYINPQYLPLNVQSEPEQLKHFIQNRLIPISRENLSLALKKCRVSNSLVLSFKAHCASLSDMYWIKKDIERAEWDNVKFFDKTYSYDFGNLMFELPTNRRINLYTPDITTNGQLLKTWRNVNGKNFLYKSGMKPDFQEAINEVFCSKIAENFEGLDYVKYYISEVNGRLCSVCENFITEKEEFVPAYQIYRIEEKQINEDVYSHLLRMCDKVGIKYAKEFIEKMIAFDYLIDNRDRHMGNFGWMRNTDTLQFTRPAPIFDNGTSMWVGSVIEEINKNKESLDQSIAKPFANTHKQQIKLVKQLDFIKFLQLKEMDEYLYELCTDYQINENKRDALCQAYKYKITNLEKYREREMQKKIYNNYNKDSQTL